jgi:hypothetical protein
MQSVHAISETLDFYRRLLEEERARLAILEDEASEVHASLTLTKQRRVIAGIEREIATLEDVLALRTA